MPVMPIQFPIRKRSKKSRFIWGTAFLAGAVVAGTITLSIYIGWKLTHPVKLALDANPTEYQLDYEDVEFPSLDPKITLKGWYLPAQSPTKGMTLIFAHGYNKNRLQPDVPLLPIVKAMVDSGYNALMFDFRNSGESGGTMTSVGEYEKRDLLAAIDWVKTNRPSKIGLIGYSMGATTAILAAAEEPSVVGVVADSPFSNLKSYLKDNLSHWSNLPNFPFTPLIMTFLPPITGLHPEEVDALAAVDHVYPRPILFIHSETDDAIPYTESELMQEKHPDKFTLWKTTDGALHIGSYERNKDEYIARIKAFFEPL